MATANTKSVAGSSRFDELKAMLETRRRELAREVRGKIRDARTDSLLERDVLDQGESSEVDTQDAIGFALIQMKAETLDKIDAYHLGAFIQMLEFQTAFVGELLGIDAFDQPGVELGKVYTFGLMGRKGYEEYRVKFDEYEAKRAAVKA